MSPALLRRLAIVNAVVLAALALQACGAPPIERLAGEPPAAKPYTKVVAPNPPVADAINRFNAAVRRGAVEEAYERLSRATRLALTVRAQTVGLRGVDLLRPPGPKVGGSARKLFITDPMATFTARGIKTIRVGKRPWSATNAHDGRTLVWLAELVDAKGQTRRLTLRFEGVLWRIHHPSLKTPETAAK